MNKKKNQIKGYFHMTDFHLCNISSFFLTGNLHCGRRISQERTKIYNWCNLGKKMNCFLNFVMYRKHKTGKFVWGIKSQ